MKNKNKSDIVDKATSRTGVKTTLLWSFVSCAVKNFVSENVIAEWKNFKNAFPGFSSFQFAVCGWNCIGRYRVIRAPYQTVARQLGDIVV